MNPNTEITLLQQRMADMLGANALDLGPVIPYASKRHMHPNDHARLAKRRIEAKKARRAQLKAQRKRGRK